MQFSTRDPVSQSLFVNKTCFLDVTSAGANLSRIRESLYRVKGRSVCVFCRFMALAHEGPLWIYGSSGSNVYGFTLLYLCERTENMRMNSHMLFL